MFTIQSQADITESIALSFDEVVAVRALEHNGYIVVAVLTGPIFSQMERDNLLQSIKNMVADTLDIADKQVITSYDMELFRALGNIDEYDKDKILEKAMRINNA